MISCVTSYCLKTLSSNFCGTCIFFDKTIDVLVLPTFSMKLLTFKIYYKAGAARYTVATAMLFFLRIILHPGSLVIWGFFIFNNFIN